MMRFDADGDGRISLEEAPDRLKERFGSMDANDDGFVDEEEMKRLRERMRGGRRPGG